MKRLIGALLSCAVLLPCLLLIGCQKTGEVTAQSGVPECKEHQYGAGTETLAGYLTPGEARFVCEKCGYVLVEETEPVTSISILAIGNSFSEDAMEHLWGILKSAGFEEVILGNLFIGGCSLDQHWINLKNGRANYTYFYNDSGLKQSFNGYSVQQALEQRSWDIITVQQASPDSGMKTSYGALAPLTGMLASLQPEAKIYWHMTWAYQAGSNHSGFIRYGKDQMTMYNAIVNAADELVVSNAQIEGIIPAGTAIQNLRTYEIGDTLTRDGYHLSYDVGRYTAALCWYAALTGLPVDWVDYIPANMVSIQENMADIQQAVADAVQTPMEVTSAK